MPTATLRSLALALSCSSLALAACGGVLDETTPTAVIPAPTVTPKATPASGALRWSRAYGGPFDDAAGSLVLTPGSHARFPGGGLIDGATDPGEVRGLLMDVDGDGSLAAHQRLGTSSLYPIGVSLEALGAKGRRILAGGFSHTTSLAGCALAGPTGAGGQFVAALDDKGACLWATTFAASVSFSSLDVSPTGEILIAGEGKPGASLGSGVTLPTPEDGGARFYARLSATGTPLFARGVESFALPIARFDSFDGLLVAARTSLARFDAHGAPVWSRALPEGVSINALTTAGSTAVVVLREAEQLALWSVHTSDGSEAWKVDLTGASPQDLGALALGASASGAVVVAAHFPGDTSLALGPTTLAGTGKSNLFWALLDGQGTVVRSHVVPTEGTVYPSSVATDAGGDVWILGTFTGSLDFGDGVHVAQPGIPSSVPALNVTGYDVFLARYH